MGDHDRCESEQRELLQRINDLKLELAAQQEEGRSLRAKLLEVEIAAGKVFIGVDPAARRRSLERVFAQQQLDGPTDPPPAPDGHWKMKTTDELRADLAAPRAKRPDDACPHCWANPCNCDDSMIDPDMGDQ